MHPEYFRNCRSVTQASWVSTELGYINMLDAYQEAGPVARKGRSKTDATKPGKQKDSSRKLVQTQMSSRNPEESV